MHGCGFLLQIERSYYFYQWWIPEHAGGKASIFAGNGFGGQF
jgi:hypothetical protein